MSGGSDSKLQTGKSTSQTILNDYLKLWADNKNSFDSHTKLTVAGEIFSLEVCQELWKDAKAFLSTLDHETLAELKHCNTKFVKSLAQFYMEFGQFGHIYKMIEDEISCLNREDLLKLWDEAHYQEKEKTLGRPLTPLIRFRVRQRNPPPSNICPTGMRPSSVLPEMAKEILRKWLDLHQQHPYPDMEERLMLSSQTGLSEAQVKTWFANARRRLRAKLKKAQSEDSHGKRKLTVSRSSLTQPSPVKIAGNMLRTSLTHSIETILESNVNNVPNILQTPPAKSPPRLSHQPLPANSCASYSSESSYHQLNPVRFDQSRRSETPPSTQGSQWSPSWNMQQMHSGSRWCSVSPPRVEQMCMPQNLDMMSPAYCAHKETQPLSSYSLPPYMMGVSSCFPSSPPHGDIPPGSQVVKQTAASSFMFSRGYPQPPPSAADHNYYRYMCHQYSSQSVSPPSPYPAMVPTSCRPQGIRESAKEVCQYSTYLKDNLSEPVGPTPCKQSCNYWQEQPKSPSISLQLQTATAKRDCKIPISKEGSYCRIDSTPCLPMLGHTEMESLPPFSCKQGSVVTAGRCRMLGYPSACDIDVLKKSDLNSSAAKMAGLQKPHSSMQSSHCLSALMMKSPCTDAGLSTMKLPVGISPVNGSCHPAVEECAQALLDLHQSDKASPHP